VCGLPEAWADRPAWTVLDTGFHDGKRFLETWLVWRNDPHRARMLHYVGIAPHDACLLSSAMHALQASPETPEHHRLAHELAEQCRDLEPGFRRITLEQGTVSLTLCLGPLDAMLGEHDFLADTLYASAPLDKWKVQLLARRCKRGTRLYLSAPPVDSGGGQADPLSITFFRGAGFRMDGPVTATAAWSGRFDPHWHIPNSRNPARHETPAPARCAVVGAGIAGASVAHALAQRGWQVTVLDQDAAPASGASGLPAGLAVPHVSVDDSPRSRMTRIGIRLLEQHAKRFLTSGQDWEQSGVWESRPDGPARWHPHAAWVKPYRLVDAWLAQPRIAFAGNTKIATLQRSDGLWSLGNEHGQNVGPFEAVVVANAMGCATLLTGISGLDQSVIADLSDKLSALQAIHGTLSHGRYAEEIPDLPATPVNGNGCFIPHVPDASGEQWCAGSTFESDALAAADIWTQHASNMARLQHLLPGVGRELAETLDRGPASQWSATRCVTHDRLPLVGPVGGDPRAGLWICIGMGSRGLSFAALCAELLVARLCAEPLPLEFSLARSLDANRVRRKRQTDGVPRNAD
jgi:tRNA 5-methylaminomethyl-2-thiouridine biosynthesis bifunctional protein